MRIVDCIIYLIHNLIFNFQHTTIIIVGNFGIAGTGNIAVVAADLGIVTDCNPAVGYILVADRILADYILVGCILDCILAGHILLAGNFDILPADNPDNFLLPDSTLLILL